MATLLEFLAKNGPRVSPDLWQKLQCETGEILLFLKPMKGGQLYFCLDLQKQEILTCCKVDIEKSNSLLKMHHYLVDCQNVNKPDQMLFRDRQLFLLFQGSYGDLLSYVIRQERLSKPEAKRLFRQLVETTRTCHEHGIILKSLRLSNLVFADAKRDVVRLEVLADALLLEDLRDDTVVNTTVCFPGYVCPEELKMVPHSGRAADVWRLGVILYVMLVGKFPFAPNGKTQFSYVLRVQYKVPQHVSPTAKCLIHSLLRKEPSERMTVDDILLHPWFTEEERATSSSSSSDLVEAVAHWVSPQ